MTLCFHSTQNFSIQAYCRIFMMFYHYRQTSERMSAVWEAVVFFLFKFFLFRVDACSIRLSCSSIPWNRNKKIAYFIHSGAVKLIQWQKILLATVPVSSSNHLKNLIFFIGFFSKLWTVSSSCMECIGQKNAKSSWNHSRNTL